MSESVVEDFNSNLGRNMQAAVMATQELIRVVQNRLEKNLATTQKQQAELKGLVDIALHHARDVVRNLHDEKFYSLASKSDLYDCYVTAHSFAHDSYCAEGVKRANARLGLLYEPGTFTSEDAETLKRRLGLTSEDVVAKFNPAPTAKQIVAAAEHKVDAGRALSFADRVKQASSVERSVMLFQGAHPKKLSDVINAAKAGKPFVPAVQPVVNMSASQKL